MRPGAARSQSQPVDFGLNASNGFRQLRQKWVARHSVGPNALSRTVSSLPQNGLEYAGRWTLLTQNALAGQDARLRFHFHARDVYVVLGGKGRVQVLVDGHPAKTLDVTEYKLYTAVTGPRTRDAVLELRFSPGVRGYSFTFG